MGSPLSSDGPNQRARTRSCETCAPVTPHSFLKTENRTTQQGCKRRGVVLDIAPQFRTLFASPARGCPEEASKLRIQRPNLSGSCRGDVCAVWESLLCESVARAPQMTPPGHESAASLTDDVQADQAIGHDGPPEPLRAPQAARHPGWRLACLLAKMPPDQPDYRLVAPFGPQQATRRQRVCCTRKHGGQSTDLAAQPLVHWWRQAKAPARRARR